MGRFATFVLFLLALTYCVAYVHAAKNHATGEISNGRSDRDSQSICSTGNQQSPISFDNTVAKRNSNFRPIQLSTSCKLGVNQRMLLERRASGFVGVLKGDKPCTVRDPMTSQLMAFDHMELHRGPEHEFSNIHANMEVQLYFHSTNGTQTIAVAVPVVCMSRRDDDMKISQFLDMFVHLSRESVEHYNASRVADDFGSHPHGILHLIPTVDRSYMSYSGSLTSAPCTEGVRWYVFTSPLHVRVNLDKDEEDLLAAEQFTGVNRRAIQPLNNRPILRYVDTQARESRDLYGKSEKGDHKQRLLGSSLAVLLALLGFALAFAVALCTFQYCSHAKNGRSEKLGDSETYRLNGSHSSYGGV